MTKLQKVLHEYHITPYKFVKEMGYNPQVSYRPWQLKMAGLRSITPAELDKVDNALVRLTGRSHEVFEVNSYRLK